MTSWRDTYLQLERKLSRLLHTVSGSWDHKRGKPKDAAFCDGLMIGSGPWLCYCCQNVRTRLKGGAQNVPKPWRPGEQMPLRFRTIYTAYKGRYAWPCVKWVYPTPAMEDASMKRQGRGWHDRRKTKCK